MNGPKLNEKQRSYVDYLHQLLIEVEHNLFVDIYRRKMFIMVTYKDYLPSGDVMKLIREVIPQEVYVTIKREYSDMHIAQTLLKAYKDNVVKVVSERGDEVRYETIRGFAQNSLGNTAL